MKNNQNNKAKFRRLIKVIGPVIFIGAIIYLTWWIYSLNISHQTNLQNPPPLKTFWGEQYLKYWSRNGSYLPQRDSKSIEINDIEYSLALELDQDYISPIYGSKISGTIQLLANGKLVNSVPSDLIEKYGDDDEKIKLFINEFGIATSTTSEILTTASGSSEMSLLPYYRSYVPLLLDEAGRKIPDSDWIKSFIYSQNIVNDDSKANEQYIQIDEPQTNFELHYLGGRISPYVEVTAGIGNNRENLGIYSTEYLYFADQKTNDWQTLDISEIKKGEYYYDVEIQGIAYGKRSETGERLHELTGNIPLRTSQYVKVSVTSRDSETDAINTESNQRVIVRPYPNSGFFPNQIANTRYQYPSSKLPIPTYLYDEKYLELSSFHVVEFGARAGTTVVSANLINGQAEFIFSVTGERTLWPSLAVVIQPEISVVIKSGDRYRIQNDKSQIIDIYTVATVEQDEMPFNSFEAWQE